MAAYEFDELFLGVVAGEAEAEKDAGRGADEWIAAEKHGQVGHAAGGD